MVTIQNLWGPIYSPGDLNSEAFALGDSSTPFRVTVTFEGVAIGTLVPTKWELRAVGDFSSPVVLDGKFLTGFKVSQTTNSIGVSVASVYPTSVLSAAGITTGEYDLLYLPEGEKDYRIARITVPDVDCMLAELIT